MKFLQFYVLVSLVASALAGCMSGRSPGAYGGLEWKDVKDDGYAVPAAPNEWTHQPVQWVKPSDEE